jgi:hypothetical protein
VRFLEGLLHPQPIRSGQRRSPTVPSHSRHQPTNDCTRPGARRVRHELRRTEET